MIIRLKFGELLERRGVSPYRLWKYHGLTKNTVYALANPSVDRVRVDLDVLGEAMRAVAVESGEPVALADVLEVVADPVPTVETEEETGESPAELELATLLEAARLTARIDRGQGGKLPPRDAVPLKGTGPTIAEMIAEDRI